MNELHKNIQIKKHLLKAKPAKIKLLFYLFVFFGVMSTTTPIVLSILHASLFYSLPLFAGLIILGITMNRSIVFNHISAWEKRKTDLSALRKILVKYQMYNDLYIKRLIDNSKFELSSLIRQSSPKQTFVVDILINVSISTTLSAIVSSIISIFAKLDILKYWPYLLTFILIMFLVVFVLLAVRDFIRNSNGNNSIEKKYEIFISYLNDILLIDFPE
ncbi:MAG: hypothetical protein Q8876_09605 [Bacillota bacterium]|nr:hypothetical protein [Bacillota bacterium]